MPQENPDQPGLLHKFHHHWVKPTFTLMGAAALIGTVFALFSLLNSLHVIGPDKTYGNCKLKPPSLANVDAVRAHLQTGLRYERTGQSDLAEREFSEVLQADPGFIGANLDLGYAYLLQNDFTNAETAFNRELDSVECLRTVPPRDLSQFAYMLNAASGSDVNTSYKTRLDTLEDAVHYNLACLRVKQKNFDSARAQLQKASANCTIPESTVRHDHDLATLTENAPADFYGWINCPAASR